MNVAYQCWIQQVFCFVVVLSYNSKPNTDYKKVCIGSSLLVNLCVCVCVCVLCVCVCV